MGATPARLAVLAVCVGLGVAACAGARIVDGVFHGRNYRIEPPAGWQVVPDGRADLSLSRQDAPGRMLVNATCGGREPERALPVLTRQLLFGLKEPQILAHAQVEVGGEPAVRTLFEGKSGEADAVQGEAYVVKGAHCVYDLLYVSPPAFFEQGRPDFDRFVRSLRRP